MKRNKITMIFVLYILLASHNITASTPDLVLDLQFEDGVVDLTGKNPTMSSNDVAIQCNTNCYADFNGFSSNIIIDPTIDWLFFNAMSIFMDINLRGIGPDMNWIFGSYRTFVFQIANDGELLFRLSEDGKQWHESVATTEFKLTTNTWYNIGVVYADKTVSFYNDKQLVEKFDVNTTLFRGYDKKIELGHFGYSYGETRYYMDGLLDNFTVSDEEFMPAVTETTDSLSDSVSAQKDDNSDDSGLSILNLYFAGTTLILMVYFRNRKKF